MVGAGGVYVDLLRANVVLTTPFDRDAVQAAIDKTSLRSVLDGFRGLKFNEEAVLDVVAGVQAAMLSEPRIESLEINPLILTSNGAIAADAKVVLTEAVAHGGKAD